MLIIVRASMLILTPTEEKSAKRRLVKNFVHDLQLGHTDIFLIIPDT